MIGIPVGSGGVRQGPLLWGGPYGNKPLFMPCLPARKAHSSEGQGSPPCSVPCPPYSGAHEACIAGRVPGRLAQRPPRKYWWGLLPTAPGASIGLMLWGGPHWSSPYYEGAQTQRIHLPFRSPLAGLGLSRQWVHRHEPGEAVLAPPGLPPPLPRNSVPGKGGALLPWEASIGWPWAFTPMETPPWALRDCPYLTGPPPSSPGTLSLGRTALALACSGPHV